VEKEANVWGFAHLTFQEYLCAAQWVKTREPAGWTQAQWQPLIAESWWHETLRLYAAQADADVLVQTCLVLNSNMALQLAGEIEREALSLTPAIRETVTHALSGMVLIRLRSEPATVSDEEAPQVFGIDGVPGRPLEYIQNQYEDRGEVVFDHATGLLWQKSGAENVATYADGEKYIEDLNARKFAGYDDWRLPTIPELISLLEPEKQTNDRYFDELFDERIYVCWSCDKRSRGSAWGVRFHLGNVYWNLLDGKGYVRAVRS
jgi:hypothetical protein